MALASRVLEVGFRSVLRMFCQWVISFCTSSSLSSMHNAKLAGVSPCIRPGSAMTIEARVTILRWPSIGLQKAYFLVFAPLGIWFP